MVFEGVACIMSDIAEVGGVDVGRRENVAVDVKDVVAGKGMSVVSEEPSDLRSSAFRSA